MRGERGENEELLAPPVATDGSILNPTNPFFHRSSPLLVAPTPHQVALEAIRSNNTEMEIAASIRKQFEQMFPSVWHCFVGRNFGSHVTHEATKHIYFYIGQTGVCLFATA